MDVVQSDIKEAKEDCIKLPQCGFVIFFDSDPAEIRFSDERQIRKAAEEEVKQFTEMKDEIIKVLQSMAQVTQTGGGLARKPVV